MGWLASQINPAGHWIVTPLLNKPASQLAILLEAGVTFTWRQISHLQPCRVAGKRVEGRLERHHDANPATGYLRGCFHPLGAHVVDPVHGLAPQTRALANLN